MKTIKLIAIVAILALTSCSTPEDTSTQPSVNINTPVTNLPTSFSDYTCYRLSQRSILLPGNKYNYRASVQTFQGIYPGPLINTYLTLSATDYPTEGHYHNKVKQSN